MAKNKNNKLVIACAGSGKTTLLINKSLEIPLNEKILITTYTYENSDEIRKKFIKKHGYVPENVTIMPWFTFMLTHLIKPYQDVVHPDLFEQSINGVNMVNKKSAVKYYNKRNIPVYYEKTNVMKYYFDKSVRVYSDKLSELSCLILGLNSYTLERLCKIFDHVFIDEVQDMVGYDLDLIKCFFQSKINILLVGDPRQVTTTTHFSTKNKKYNDGNIKTFLEEKCKSYLSEDSIDETTLMKSHRNHPDICLISSLLFPTFVISESCDCCSRDEKFQGVHLVRKEDVEEYIKSFCPVQLRYNKKEKTSKNAYSINMKLSKGRTYPRVLIYPTKKMGVWIKEVLSSDFKPTRALEPRCVLYVALTRSSLSTAIVYDYQDDCSNIEKSDFFAEVKI